VVRPLPEGEAWRPIVWIVGTWEAVEYRLPELAGSEGEAFALATAHGWAVIRREAFGVLPPVSLTDPRLGPILRAARRDAGLPDPEGPG
jgi:hypothetical protein